VRPYPDVLLPTLFPQFIVHTGEYGVNYVTDGMVYFFAVNYFDNSIIGTFLGSC
jgi:hypothetical protein